MPLKRSPYSEEELLSLLAQIAPASDDVLQSMVDAGSQWGTFSQYYPTFVGDLKAKGEWPVGGVPWRLTREGFQKKAVRVITSAAKEEKLPRGMNFERVLEKYQELVAKIAKLLANETLVGDEPDDTSPPASPPPPPPPAASGGTASA